VELPFLHSFGIEPRYKGRAAIAGFYDVVKQIYPDLVFKPEEANGNEGGQSFARFSKSLARRPVSSAASQPARCPDLPVSTYRCSGRGDLLCPCLANAAACG
jgi:hypothetical protein